MSSEADVIPTNIADLPDELLQQALFVVAADELRALLKCSAVCQRWRAAARHVLETGCHDLTVRADVSAPAMVWLGTCPQSCQVVSLRICGAACVAGLTFLSTSSLGRQRLSQLTTLVIVSCSQLRDVSLQQTLQHCKGLRRLELVNCARLTDRALDHISHYCTDLTHLGLRDLHGIHDDSVCRLLTRCTRLQRLSLVGALHLTWAVLQAASQHCPDLAVIAVARCPGLNTPAITRPSTDPGAPMPEATVPVRAATPTLPPAPHVRDAWQLYTSGSAQVVSTVSESDAADGSTS